MLRAVSIITCLTITLVYLLLIILIYPHACWIKHRPSDDNYQMHPSYADIIKIKPTKFCPNHDQLNLMPMPSHVILPNTIENIRIPSIVRIETKRPLPFLNLKSFDSALFTLFIDYESDVTDHFYPDLGIDESYKFNITSTNHASLFAKTYVGVIRGLSTFTQLQQQDKIPIPLVIIDEPQFVWRGLMLDVARHFISISIIQQTIDFMQLVKMNVLHLHLSDDQAFRLESKRFPRLHDSHEYYSQLDMKNLIEYARQRAVRIVPEFDMPGHTTSWFIGYPQLASARKLSFKPEDSWGVKNATMDVSRESTYDFLDAFLSEMTHLFPDKYFHIGGDECTPYEWMQSEEIQRFMNQKQLYGYHSLQAYFTRRIEDFLNKHDRKYCFLLHFYN